MYSSRIRQRFTAVLGALIVLSLVMIPAAIPTTATHLGPYGHQWGTYKWKNPTTGSPIKLNIRDNSLGTWAKEFGIAVADWERPHDVTTLQMETYPSEQLRSDR